MANLRPSSIKEYELGTEFDLFNNRLHLDLTFYDKQITRSVIPAVTSETSGYNAVLSNSGTLENKGVEVLFSGIPVKSRNFTWTETVNFNL